MAFLDGSVARLSGVTHEYKGVTALRQIELDIPAGKMVALIGPDAVGKSTLMSLVTGARRIQQGCIEVLGGDISKRHHRKIISPKIAYMPQGLGKNLFMELTVLENMDFFGRLFNKTKTQRATRIDILLKVAGLIAFANRPAGKLSGGMKQKLGLCCALLHDPDFLILDEPTTGVDPVSRRQFWQLIKTLRQSRPQMSVLVSTAYMDEAEQFDWIIAMHGGTILDAGAPIQIKKRTNTDSLELAFVELMPKLESKFAGQLELPPRLDQDSTIAITARNLTRRFGDFVAVDNVSFDIRRGEIFGFLGSNGCGKTTTMKMLTGLLPPSEGSASLFGSKLDGQSLAARKRVGYMSQGFSLYGELTVIQNLRLHTRLYHLPASKQLERIDTLVSRFELKQFLEVSANSLPLGIKQRLSLAVAVIHEPDLLILDEPTSGVDPIARDQFWRILISLSRNEGVTIFISTHFMNEAMRCDRVSLMHAGKVLASDTPQNLIKSSNSESFEEAAVNYIQSAMSDGERTDISALKDIDINGKPDKRSALALSLQRLWAHSVRETQEILRDPIRLAFAFLGMTLMLFILTYGMVADVEDIHFAVLDLDQTPESRAYLNNLGGSRYFNQLPASSNLIDLRKRLVSREINFSVEIPPGFGRKIKKQTQANLYITVDGANPSHAALVESYINRTHDDFLKMLGHYSSRKPELIVPRFRYNPTLENINAMAPSMPALLLILFPALLGAISVVREKEIGTITNFYVTSATKLEFLLGKQLPYIVIGMVNFVIMVLSIIFIMGVPIKGSLMALSFGALAYVIVATNYGLFTSAFSRTQAAAVFITTILSILPTVSFSGLSQPVSTLEGGAQIIGKLWPTTYFMNISVGSFTKGLSWSELSADLLLLCLFIPIFLGLSMWFLKKQET
ncbi:MAG: ribosome-dependent ATPase [Arenicella sp.]|jgi:ribosome-dependent ATPase